MPNAGFLPDLHIRAKSPSWSFGNITIAPASTVLMVPKDGSGTEGLPKKNVPAESHWVDLTQKGTIVVMQQPKGQICAVLGGIMAQRMGLLNAKGVVVHGRVRDIEQLKESGLVVSRFVSLCNVVLASAPRITAKNLPLPLEHLGTGLLTSNRSGQKALQ